jgi:hypothetical protein
MLLEQYGSQVFAPVHMRAAVAEASAQSLPIHGLGNRQGASDAAQEFDTLLDSVVPEMTRSGGAVVAPAPSAATESIGGSDASV